MSTKKVFIELIAFLETKKDSKISDILKSDAFKDLILAKKNGNTVLKDQNDNIVAIFCWYHKKWELLFEVEYGSKASHHTGLNTMCKIGVNLWTKQQAEAKKAKAELLDKVADGEVEVKDVAQLVSDIEDERNLILLTNAPKGTVAQPTLLEMHEAEAYSIVEAEAEAEAEAKAEAEKLKKEAKAKK